MEERVFGHYRVVEELGRGGMGVVYKAFEESLNRSVAIKVLAEHLTEDEDFVKRFKREAQSAAGLSHPNVIQIFFIGDEQGVPYFRHGVRRRAVSEGCSEERGGHGLGE